MKLLVGSEEEEFDEFIKDEAYFVDKTHFIQEFMNDGRKNVAILRPRRFGKSKNLSMLKSFLSLGAQSSLIGLTSLSGIDGFIPPMLEIFDKFRVAEDKEFVARHCAQYPVVYFNLKDCSGENFH